jgi:hypothetical protein
VAVIRNPTALDQRTALQKQTDSAIKFGQGMKDYVGQESSGLQQALMEKAGAAKKNLLGEFNRRGLLRSGQRGLGEANLQADFGSQFESGRADIYQKAQDKAQQMFLNPAMGGLDAQMRALGVQSNMQQIKDQQSAARANLFGGAMGMIGGGLGSYFGGAPGGVQKPTTSYSAYNQMPGTMRS